MFGTTAFRGLRLSLNSGLVSVSRFHVSSKHGIEYGYLAYMLGERTSKRFGPNSKIITVDGNLASGKGKLAEELAKRLGMKYFPEVDQFYLDKTYGDGNILPSKFAGLCSLEKFYQDPRMPDGNAYRLQIWLFTMRMIQYAEVLEHLLSTGQGAIVERSAFSDYVFLEAMLKNGYIRPQCVTHYNEIKHVSIDEYLPPHIAIYVDVPAAEVYKNIQEKGDAFEKKVELSYIQSIENIYKTSFLPKISETTEVLQYSGGDALNMEQIAEEIEYIKITKGPWLEQNDVTYHNLRILVQDKFKVASLFVLPTFIPEVTVGGAMYDKLYYEFRNNPGKKYAQGFNEDVGDQYILWK
ncbi:NADH dehydrogenase [ubiquinone] 1 alpha subcomplex subunit 10, mitochondrial [Mantella aurantiaca]